MATIVALVVSDGEPPNIDQRSLESVLRRPLTIGQTAAGLLVGSQRDQIEVIVATGRIEARDLSGSDDFGTRKTSSVLSFFVREGHYGLTTYGVNFVLSLLCPNPEAWIVDNILARDLAEKSGRTLLGGGAHLRLAAGEKLWRVSFDPAENDSLILNFNASQKAGQLPTADALMAEQAKQYEALLKFLEQLGL